MSIAKRVEKYLESQRVPYRLHRHDYSEGSFNTAQAAQIDDAALAKAVLLRDEDFGYRLCVLPAQHKILRHTLNQIFDRHLELVDEDELAEVFPDCAPGAVPALGQAYGLEVIWDPTLLAHENIYLEAGDHEHLVVLRRNDFERLMHGALSDAFSSKRKRHTFRRKGGRRSLASPGYALSEGL
ncbi:aminoacyl-tRNA deacylase [Marinimicrobium alkaliphilum]|uniref:aminoacyl-tRNA deacylase n=1 Tax=Marinimicrobium alkaliphilum TaxID=2202654 RepID=UPI000DB93C02|nr:YbaK/EbsC family protein [Marinimicrobium alkaliphilum]